MNNANNANIANEALKQRLYVSGWMLSDTLKDCRDRPEEYIIKDYSLYGFMLGVIVLEKKSGFAQCFVKKEFRKLGIGRDLVKKIKLEYSGRIRFEDGIRGSEKFWGKVV